MAFPEPYVADADRYTDAKFRRCGASGIQLPLISLGLWQNFGRADVFETGRATLRRAFDSTGQRFNGDCSIGFAQFISRHAVILA
jgi:hypothetical protein